MNKCEFYCNYIGNRARSTGGGGTTYDAIFQDIVDTCASNAGKSYTDTVTIVGEDTYSSTHHMGSLLMPNGCIYQMPNKVTNIRVIDTSTATSTTVGDFSSLGSNTKRYCGVLGPDGYIYASPNGDNKYLKIDSAGTSFNTIETSVSTSRCGTLAKNGSIYFLPYDNTIIKLNTSTGTLTTISGGISSINSSVLAPNGCIYGARLSTYGSGARILKINPDTDTITTFGECTSAYRSCNVAPNGCVYFIPEKSSGDILKVSVDNDLVTPIAISVPDWVPSDKLITHSMSALASNGCIYSFCTYINSSGKDSYALFKLNTISDSYSYTTLDFGFIGGFGSLTNPILATNGCIYIANSSYFYIVKIDPGSDVNTNFQTNTLLSPYLNKY